MSFPTASLEDADVPLHTTAEETSSHQAMSSSSSSSSSSPSSKSFSRPPIDKRRDRYPFSLVWGPLPLITWLIPFIGHMGICDSEGRVHDFAGPYTIGLDRFMVPVTRILPIDVSSLPPPPPSSSAASSDAASQWDDAIHTADAHFAETMHNIACNNCHHHTAMAMRQLGLQRSFGTQVQCAWQMLVRGHWKSTGAMLMTLGPFLVIATIIVLAVTLTR